MDADRKEVVHTLAADFEVDRVDDGYYSILSQIDTQLIATLFSHKVAVHDVDSSIMVIEICTNERMHLLICDTTRTKTN